MFGQKSKKPEFKVTCLEFANAEFVRVDASSKRWNKREEAEGYAATVAQSREPRVEPAYPVLLLTDR